MARPLLGSPDLRWMVVHAAGFGAGVGLALAVTWRRGSYELAWDMTQLRRSGSWPDPRLEALRADLTVAAWAVGVPLPR